MAFISLEKSTVLACALTATCLASPASAAQFLFTFDSEGVDVTGTLTTTDVPDALGAVEITAASGTASGFGAITLIARQGFAGNDNLLFPGTGQLLSANGFSFSAAGLNANLFFSTALGSFVLFGSTATSTGALGIGTFAVTPVVTDPVPAIPEPSTWALMLLGFGLVGAALRRPRIASATLTYG